MIIYCFGASDVLFPYAIDYFRIYLSGTLFSLLAVSMNQFIIAQGYAKEGMISVCIGAICNILFDPLFIFVFGFDDSDSCCLWCFALATS